MKKTVKVLSALMFTGILGACAPTQTSRGTGQVIDDAALTARVKTNIAKSESFSEAAQVNVDTYRGVVSLSGFVDSEKQKRDLGQVAKQVAGVEKVFNNLQIKPTASGQ